MFDRILSTALKEAAIDAASFDAAIRKAGFKSRIDWFMRGAPPSLVDAYNARAKTDTPEARP